MAKYFRLNYNNGGKVKISCANNFSFNSFFSRSIQARNGSRERAKIGIKCERIVKEQRKKQKKVKEKRMEKGGKKDKMKGNERRTKERTTKRVEKIS